MSPAALLTRAIEGHREALDLLSDLAPQVEAAGGLLVDCLQAGGKVLLCGNGGSSSDAQHFAGELVGRFLTERQPLPAIALSGMEAALTAIANDYSYEESFSRQVRALGKPGDVLVAISTSGSSPNVVRAATEARDLGMKVIGMTSSKRGALEGLSDVLLAAPSAFTPRVQEMHILLIHVLCEAVDHAFPVLPRS
jgi:D-sedoheptulose 7-phosphate isomerase